MIHKRSFAVLLSLLSIMHIVHARSRNEKKVNLNVYKSGVDWKALEKLRTNRGFAQFCHDSSSSSSSSSDCDDSDQCKPKCDRVIPITQLPVTLTQSGKYCLAKDLDFNGIGAAVTIVGDNISLNLANHSITLTSLSTGILIADSTEITISNDALVYAPKVKGPGGAAGILIFNSDKVAIENNAFFDFDAGVLIEDSVDVTVRNTRFSATLIGIFTSNSQAINIQDCAFTDALEGLRLDNQSRDIFISGVIETNSLAGSFIRWADAVTIENSVFQSVHLDNPLSLLQIGSSVDEEAVVNDISIRNSQFLNRTQITSTDPGAGFDGILFAAGSNALLENCTVDTNAAPFLGDQPFGLFPYINGALHFSQTLPTSIAPIPAAPTRIFSNVRVTNCVLSNLGSNAVVTENSTNTLTFEGNAITSGGVGVLLQGTTTTVIKSNEIQNNGTGGVLLGSSSLLQPEVGSSSNSVLNNVISDNGFSGVEINPLAANNLVQFNQVFGNGLRGINNTGVNNSIFNNTAFFNGVGIGDNYAGVSVVNFAGNPTVSGENLSA